MAARLSSTLLRTQTDTRLTALAAQGSEPAFEALVERYRRALYGYCRRLLLDEASTEDVVQQAFLSTWQALRDGREIADIKPWLYRVVHNGALNALKRSGYRYEELDEALTGTEAPDEDLDRRIAVRRTLAGLAALPELQRQALLQTAVEGRSHEDVARELGLTDGAVRGLVYRARATLRAAATAITPTPLVTWVASAEARGGSTAERIAEIAAGGGSVGAAMLMKGGAAIVTAGALAGGAVVAERAATGSPPAIEREAGAAERQSGGGGGTASGPGFTLSMPGRTVTEDEDEDAEDASERRERRERSRERDDDDDGRSGGGGGGDDDADDDRSGSSGAGSGGDDDADDDSSGRGRGRGGDDADEPELPAGDRSGRGRGGEEPDEPDAPDEPDEPERPGDDSAGSGSGSGGSGSGSSGSGSEDDEPVLTIPVQVRPPTAPRDDDPGDH